MYNNVGGDLMRIDKKVQRGQILKTLRKEKGLNQGELAKFIGVSVQAYQKYEYGTAEPSFDSICNLADFYGKSVDYLLGRDEQPQYDNERLKEGLKEVYLSLPRNVRADILQAMVDTVQSYQQGESNTTIEQSCSEVTNDTKQLKDEAQVEAIQEETAQSGGNVDIQETVAHSFQKIARNGNPFLIPDSKIEEAITNIEPTTPDYFED